MMPHPLQTEPSHLGRVVRFDDFPISWAGENPFGDGYCLGSEDGRYRLLTTDLLPKTPGQVSPSGESVNGIAFTNRFMAVSTRCEVSFLDLDPRFARERPFIFEGGAHGVLATSAGGFVAPLGVNGLLRVPVLNDSEARTMINKAPDASFNFYQLATLHGDGTRDFIAAAARRDGIVTLELNSESNNGRPDSFPYFRAPDVDFVGVCSLGSREWPFSVAGLGRDGTIHLIRNIVGKQPPSTCRISNLQGACYSIVHLDGHLFVLTNKALYVLPGLAARFLEGSAGSEPDPVAMIEMNAVDIYATRREILIEMGDHLRIATAEELIQHSGSANGLTDSGPKLSPVEMPWKIDSALVSTQERAA